MGGVECQGRRQGSESPWLSVRYSTCEELTTDGAEEVLLLDMRGS